MFPRMPYDGHFFYYNPHGGDNARLAAGQANYSSSQTVRGQRRTDLNYSEGGHAYPVHTSSMLQPEGADAVSNGWGLRHGGFHTVHGNGAVSRPGYWPETSRGLARRLRLYTFVEGSLTPEINTADVVRPYIQSGYELHGPGQSNLQEIPRVEHLHYKYAWKGLNVSQAAEIKLLEEIFESVLEGILDEYFQGLLGANLNPGPPPELSTYKVPVYLATIMYGMLAEMQKWHTQLKWFSSLGDMRSVLRRFIFLHDCISAATPGQQQPNIVHVGARLIVDPDLPTRPDVYSFSPLRMLPVPSPDFIEFEGQVPSPINEGRQIIFIPHYLSAIHGNLCACSGADSPAEVSFSSHAPWLKWNDMLGAFVGIVPFKSSFRDETSLPASALPCSPYTACVDVEATLTVRFDGNVCFEKMVFGQLVLSLRPRNLVRMQTSNAVNREEVPNVLKADNMVVAKSCGLEGYEQYNDGDKQVPMVLNMTQYPGKKDGFGSESVNKDGKGSKVEESKEQALDMPTCASPIVQDSAEIDEFFSEIEEHYAKQGLFFGESGHLVPDHTEYDLISKEDVEGDSAPVSPAELGNAGYAQDDELAQSTLFSTPELQRSSVELEGQNSSVLAGSPENRAPPGMDGAGDEGAGSRTATISRAESRVGALTYADALRRTPPEEEEEEEEPFVDQLLEEGRAREAVRQKELGQKGKQVEEGERPQAQDEAQKQDQKLNQSPAQKQTEKQAHDQAHQSQSQSQSLQAPSPIKTIRSEDGKIWAIDDSYLVNKQDKYEFWDILRAISMQEGYCEGGGGYIDDVLSPSPSPATSSCYGWEEQSDDDEDGGDVDSALRSDQSRHLQGEHAAPAA